MKPEGSTVESNALVILNKPAETDEVAVEYRGTYLLISNRNNTPSKVIGAWLKRWRSEVLFRTAKQKLGMLNCHSPNGNYIYTHLRLLFSAETSIRYMSWEQKTAGKGDCTDGQVIRNLLCIRCRIRQAVRLNEQDSIAIDLGTPAKQFERFVRKLWIKRL